MPQSRFVDGGQRFAARVRDEDNGTAHRGPPLWSRGKRWTLTGTLSGYFFRIFSPSFFLFSKTLSSLYWNFIVRASGTTAKPNVENLKTDTVATCAQASDRYEQGTMSSSSNNGKNNNNIRSSSCSGWSTGAGRGVCCFCRPSADPSAVPTAMQLRQATRAPPWAAARELRGPRPTFEIRTLVTRQTPDFPSFVLQTLC